MIFEPDEFFNPTFVASRTLCLVQAPPHKQPLNTISAKQHGIAKAKNVRLKRLKTCQLHFPRLLNITLAQKLGVVVWLLLRLCYDT